MFLVKRRRTRVVAVALLAKLLSPVTAYADSWNGTRENGSNHNGYWIAQSGVPYASTITSAYNVWIQACNSSGNLKLFQLAQRLVGTRYPTGYVRDQDIISVLDYPSSSDASAYIDKAAVGASVILKKASDGKPILDVDPPTNSNRHRNWYCIRIEIFRKSIEETAYNLELDANAYTRGTLVHEIGHSLKMAHPPEGFGPNPFRPSQIIGVPYVAGTLGHLPGEGSQTMPGRTRSFGSGYSVMLRQNGSSDLSPYDLEELEYRWGRP